MTHHVRESEQLRHIRSLRELIPFLRDEPDWPIDSEAPEDITFGYDPKDLGIDGAAAVRIREIRQLRPLAGGQPWGIFWTHRKRAYGLQGNSAHFAIPAIFCGQIQKQE
jgi:hypothetical protein